ncbi:p21-activated protein kinase-interacting protein 1-like protein [Geranomyces variabilis]|nr:p21-activated protein kinase-interacting protein 1-like protein [Geranomyces variabilis]
MTDTTTLGDGPYDFRLIVGTYERLLYGIDATRPAEASPADNAITLTPVFIYPAHISCIKAAATTHRFLATGSTDEHIKLYDLRQRKEVGTLMHHSGSITCLQFYKKTHLFTASEDGAISIVRTSDWEVLKTLDAHKRSVNWFDVHPSGKVLLSVGGDSTLKCWDLAKAACTYSMKLAKPAERVRWSPSGTRYAVLMNNVVQVHDVATGEVLGSVTTTGRINSISFTTVSNAAGAVEEVVVTGGEDHLVGVYAVDGSCLMRWDSGHTNRIKDVDAFAIEGKPTIIATCSSDGGVRVWDLANVESQIEELAAAAAPPSDGKKAPLPKPTPAAEYNAKCRLTCLVIAPPPAKSTQNRAAVMSSISAAEAAAARSDAESDFEDYIHKPTVEVSFEDNDSQSPNPATPAASAAAGKKRKAPANGAGQAAKKQKPTTGGPAKKGKAAKAAKAAKAESRPKGNGQRAVLEKMKKSAQLKK